MTKGEWIISNSLVESDGFYEILTSLDEDGVCPIADIHFNNEGITRDRAEAEENAELIALAGNLNQKYELNVLPLLIKVVQMAISSYKDFGFILKSDFDELQQALSKIERKQ